MPRKRKRAEGSNSEIVAQEKPLSAIAAARLKASSTAKEEAGDEAIPFASALQVQIPVSTLIRLESQGEEEEEPVATPADIKRNFKLCNWRSEPQNILSDNDAELTVSLKKHETIALLGHFKFKVLRGAVNINGANIGAVSSEGIKSKAYDAFVPATHPILKIRGLDGRNHIQFVSCSYATPLAPLNPLFENIWNGPFTARSFAITTESDADSHGRALSPEVTPEDWLRAIEDCTNTPSIALVTGLADSGKSTFCRRLLNRCLTGLGKTVRPVPAVCFLDLDPSKAEFTTSGQISLVVVRDILIKPSFVHPATLPKGSSVRGTETIRAHSVPTSLLSYAEYYQACAEDLFLTYKNLQSHDKYTPLIINVPGHIYASRFDILERFLERFKPHNVIHTCNPKAIDVDTATKLHSIQTISSRSRGTVHTITAQAPLSKPIRTDAELQAMQIQSYFHLNWSGKKADEQELFSWNPKPLSTLVPWEFCYQETDENTQHFIGFAFYTEPSESASLLPALNGSIIQIVESTSSVIPSPYTGLPRTSRYGIPYFSKSARTGMVEPLDPRTSKLICTAMLRCFDLDRSVVQVLVPKMYEEILYTLSPERTVFVYGCCDSSQWAYLEDAHAKEEESAHAEVNMSEDTKDALPWVEKESSMERMGYLNTLRRVRKFQT